MRNIQAFSSSEIEFDEFKPEMIVRSENYFQFVISATKYVDVKKRQAFFFLRKKISTVNELIQESMQSEKKALFGNKSLLYPQTEISVIQMPEDLSRIANNFP